MGIARDPPSVPREGRTGGKPCSAPRPVGPAVCWGGGRGLGPPGRIQDETPEKPGRPNGGKTKQNETRGHELEKGEFPQEMVAVLSQGSE